jgi:hypothetical protein
MYSLCGPNLFHCNAVLDHVFMSVKSSRLLLGSLLVDLRGKMSALKQHDDDSSVLTSAFLSWPVSSILSPMASLPAERLHEKSVWCIEEVVMLWCYPDKDMNV